MDETENLWHTIGLGTLKGMSPADLEIIPHAREEGDPDWEAVRTHMTTPSMRWAYFLNAQAPVECSKLSLLIG